MSPFCWVIFSFLSCLTATLLNFMFWRIFLSDHILSLGQQGAESPQIISSSPGRLFLTHLQLIFTLLWMARNLHKLQSWNSNMLCKLVCSFCPWCLETSIVKILEKGTILLRWVNTVSSHFLVSAKKYLSDTQKISKNIAIQDFFAQTSFFEYITKKTNNDT